MVFDELIAAVNVLSLPAHMQESFLIKIGLLGRSHEDNLNRNIDELAMQFEDQMYGFSSYAEQNHLSAEFVGKINSIRDKLSEMSSKNDSFIWTVSGLFTSSEWGQIRTLSNSALREVHQDSDR